MLNMLVAFLMIIIMMIVLIMVILMVSKKVMVDSQKATPFECGFNPMTYTRLPFSIHFFLIAVIFLIFDIEIIMILPMILTMKVTVIFYWIITTISFTIILLIGLIHEWNNGMIDWTS
uniref:NADH-ubiquinone oxidoreductase chain 3 n=1 Tax=Psammotettix sp. EMHAU-2015-Zz053036 TaxID=2038643 RepID=A0A343K606_9HEMI|nr:NADH dehydrogenase subunit 3 [Psammotettix sp. EMHAU-2015-Zz053036]